MLISAFSFFRGAAHLMAPDLASGPRTGLYAQLCGDAHLSNFGIFAAPDRRLVFGVNDFDETLPGPFEWDLKRLVASFAVAGRDRGFDAKLRSRINTTVSSSYRQAMHEFAARGNLDVWYTRTDVDDARARSTDGGYLLPSGRKQKEGLAKARRKGQSPGVEQANPPGRRRAANRQRSPVDRSGRRIRPNPAKRSACTTRSRP